MTHHKLLLVASLAIPVSLVTACERTNADEQKRAAEAQREADEKIAKAQQEADKTATEAQRKADEKTDKAQNEANKDQAGAQTNANETIRAATEAIQKSRNDLREWAQKKLDSLDSDVDSAKTKAQTASAKNKADFENALKDVEAKRATVQSEIALVDTRSGADLDNLKNRLEKEIDTFRTSVSHLKATL